MEFFRKGKNQNYDLWSGYSWYVPGVAGMFAMLGWLLLGSVLGNVLSAILLLLPGMSGLSEYIMLIAYPVMFIPAAVGLLEAWDVIAPNWLPYILITLISTFVVMFFSGRVTQAVIRHSRVKEESHE